MTDPLYAAIDRHFLAPEALARVRQFPRAARDVEGWFKGELTYLFASLVADGALTDWRINVPISEGRPQRCDFRLVPDRTPLWLDARRIAPIAFKETTSLADYPPDLYIGKLTLTGGF